ncbi:MAG: hypothetical protein QNK23_18515 [Crocinitomicaceae bacterium]|nr:hypothetical protein [Crocinitomicaceae bacterium]
MNKKRLINGLLILMSALFVLSFMLPAYGVDSDTLYGHDCANFALMGLMQNVNEFSISDFITFSFYNFPNFIIPLTLLIHWKLNKIVLLFIVLVSSASAGYWIIFDAQNLKIGYWLWLLCCISLPTLMYIKRVLSQKTTKSEATELLDNF